MKSKSSSPLVSVFENPRFALGIILLVGFLAYSNTFHTPFHLDDEDSVVNNLAIRHLGDLRAIWAFAPTRVVAYLSYALNYRFGGLDVLGYHSVNFLIHILAAIALWQWVLRSWKAPAIACFTALIFVSHPLQTGAVTYIAQRGTCLAGLFYLTALLFYARSVLETGHKRLFYGISLGAALLAFFSKEMAASLPLAVACYDGIVLRDQSEKISRRIGRVLPYFILALLIPLSCVTNPSFDAATLTFKGETAPHPVMADYAATQFRVLLTYSKLLVFPLNQNLLYDYRLSKTFFEPGVLVGMATTMVLLVTAFILRKRSSAVSFAIFFFFITLIPESSIFPIPDVIFEHRMYLAVAAFALLVTTACFRIMDENKAVPALAVLVLLFSGLAYARNGVWGSELRLWSDNVRKSPNIASPYLGRGRAYNHEGQRELAIQDYNKAIQLQPDFVRAYNNRAVVYQLNGDLQNAIRDYDKIISINPKFAMAYGNRGAAYLQLGETDKALADFTSAIRIDPMYETPYTNRAAVYLQAGRWKEALSDIEQAIRINPLNPNTPLTRDRIRSFLDGEHQDQSGPV